MSHTASLAVLLKIQDSKAWKNEQVNVGRKKIIN
ncbi:mCG147498 [Mus musculus]|nr:mCG147498 [Mus musculus]